MGEQPRAARPPIPGHKIERVPGVKHQVSVTSSVARSIRLLIGRASLAGWGGQAISRNTTKQHPQELQAV